MRARKDHLDALAVALMLACCVLWGLQQVVVKLTLPGLPPFLQAAVRSAIAAVLVWGWSLARGIPLLGRDRTLGPGLAAGTLFALEFVSIYAALPRTDAARVSVFLYTAPFLVALMLPRFVPSERLDRVQLAGLACAFVALAWAFQEGFTSPRRSQWQGDALSVAAAFFWAATTLVIRTTRLAHAQPEKTLFYQLALSAVAIGLLAWAVGERWPEAGLSVATWGSLLFQSLVVAFASYLAWFWLLRHYPATRLSAFAFLTPVFGLGFAAALLGETIGARLFVALAFIAIGIRAVNRKARAIATPAGPAT